MHGIEIENEEVVSWKVGDVTALRIGMWIKIVIALHYSYKIVIYSRLDWAGGHVWSRWSVAGGYGSEREWN